jgi:hypothetical protein
MPNYPPQGRFVSHSARSAFTLRSADIIVHITVILIDRTTLSQCWRTPDLPLAAEHYVAAPTRGRGEFADAFEGAFSPSNQRRAEDLRTPTNENYFAANEIP